MTMVTDDVQPRAPGNRARMVRGGLALISLPWFGGVTAGLLMAHRDAGGAPMSWQMVAFLILFVSLFLVATAVLVRELLAIQRGIANLPRRERATPRILLYSIVGGALAGMAAVFLLSDHNWLDGPPGTVPAWVAALLTVGWLVIGGGGTLRWWRQIDEHEQLAYVQGASAAAHFVFFGGFIWWIWHRTGLAPAPDLMVLLIAMSTVWCAVWLWRKFH